MTMHSVSGLPGALLDAAVAKAFKIDFELQDFRVMAKFPKCPAICSPPSDWDRGGPIIDDERISLTWLGDQNRAPRPSDALQWRAQQHGREQMQGPTPLVAAMRLVVASRIGSQVYL